jgi:hypothetical protein
LINFAVKDVEMEIRGAIASVRDRETVLAMARTTQPVNEVHDHLWMDRATHVFMPLPEDSCLG